MVWAVWARQGPALRSLLALLGLLGPAAIALAACTSVLGLDDLRYTGAGPHDGASPLDASEPADAGVESDGALGALDARTPVTVVGALGTNLGALAVDGTQLYWVVLAGPDGGGAVQSAPKGGGSATTIAAAQPMPLDVAVDGQNVYWSVGAPPPMAAAAPVCNAMFVGKAAAGAAPACVTNTPYATQRMTLNDDDVVLLAQGTPGNQYLGFAAKGGALSPCRTIATQGPAAAIAATDPWIYVSNGNGTHFDAFQIETQAPWLKVGANLCIDDCGAPASIVDVVIDSSALNALWVAGDGTVFTAALDNTNATGARLGTIGAAPLRIARDASYVYVSAQNGSIYAVSIHGADGGANAITLASGEQAPFGIAVDSANVYWTTAGAIRAVAAPP